MNDGCFEVSWLFRMGEGCANGFNPDVSRRNVETANCVNADVLLPLQLPRFPDGERVWGFHCEKPIEV
jgi:hypothetical protein